MVLAILALCAVAGGIEIAIGAAHWITRRQASSHAEKLLKLFRQTDR